MTLSIQNTQKGRYVVRKVFEAATYGIAFLFAMHFLILLKISSFLSDYITDLLQKTMDLCKKGSQTTSFATPKPLCPEYERPTKFDGI